LEERCRHWPEIGDLSWQVFYALEVSDLDSV
jgi:hypothetical protein